MNSKGFNECETKTCETKFKNLIRSYMTCPDHNKKSGTTLWENAQTSIKCMIYFMMMIQWDLLLFLATKRAVENDHIVLLQI